MSYQRNGSFAAAAASNGQRRVRDPVGEQKKAEEFVERIKADPEGALLAYQAFEDAALRCRVDGVKAQQLLDLPSATVNHTHWIYTQHNLARTDPAKDAEGNAGHKFVRCDACKASFAELMTTDGDKWRLCPAYVKPTVILQQAQQQQQQASEFQ